jgi:hypothetical protein
MIWAEYRVGSTKKQAYTNLKRKLGPESISRKIIDYCYRLITSRITFVFGRIPRAIQSLSNEKEVRNFKKWPYKSLILLEKLCRIDLLYAQRI